MKQRKKTLQIPRDVSRGALFFLILFIVVGCGAVDYNQISVRHIIDGDTVELENGRRLRYIGIDTPETREKTDFGWVALNDPLADAAKDFNSSLVKGRRLRLEFDAQTQDKYGRLLAYCFVATEGEEGEVMVQAELLRAGLAYLYTIPPNIKYIDQLSQVYQEAKIKRVGIWAQDLDIESRSAGQFLGQRKVVSGVVQGVIETQKTIKIVLEGVRLVVFRRDQGLFEKEGFFLEPSLKGKTVKAFGLIKSYKGRVEMIVSTPWQLEVL